MLQASELDIPSNKRVQTVFHCLGNYLVCALDK
jgi:hypothetical protein